MPGMILPISQPASLRAEAERRRYVFFSIFIWRLFLRTHAMFPDGLLISLPNNCRALALKALDMRLHAAAGNSASLPGLSQKTFLNPTASASNNPVSFTPSSSNVSSGETSASAGETNEDEVLFETSVMDDAPEAGSSSKEEK